MLMRIFNIRNFQFRHINKLTTRVKRFPEKDVTSFWSLWVSGLKASKVCIPKVVCDLKWFLAYKYTFKSYMYISERKPFKKIYKHRFENS